MTGKPLQEEQKCQPYLFTFSDDSADDEHSVMQEEASLDNVSFYEKSHKQYNQENKQTCIETDVFTDGLELSEDFVSNCHRGFREDYYEQMQPPSTCIDLCKRNPLKYKLCRVEIFSSHRAICRSIESDMEIEISGRSKCGKAFNQDEVVAEIFLKNKTLTNPNSEENKVYGKIIGITKTNQNRPLHPVFVCTLDDVLIYHMKPICKTVPKIYVLNENRTTTCKIQIFKHDSQTKELIPDRFISINQSKRREYTFLVCYIKWNGLFPLGAVIGFYDGYCDTQTSLKLICLRNNVSALYRKNTVIQTEEIISRKTIYEKGRNDFSDRLCVFTIDGDQTKDIDDALSVSKTANGEYEIGVHISDVTSIIKKDDPIDLEAQDRSTSYYPGEGYLPYHMLPEPLAANICSLLPNQRRKALSIFFKFDKSGTILEQKIERTVIQSQERFTYREVQSILSSNDEELKFKKELCILRTISKRLRFQRLKNRSFSLPFEAPYEESSTSYFQSIEAHHIVEEFMILAHKIIAKELVKKFPDCVPLRVQSQPSPSKIDDWIKRYPIIGHFLFSLQHQTLKRNLVLSFDTIPDDQTSLQIPIQRYIWSKLTHDLKGKNYENIQRYIGTDEFHPEQANAYETWISFQETSSYKCSGVSEENYHFSLGIHRYVHFTSPIRRYADIIIHRLVHAMIDNTVSPFTSYEVETLCKKINRNRSREFEKQCRLFYLAKRLQNKPLLFHSLVASASDKSMFIRFPGIRHLTKSCGEIQFQLLKLKSKPNIGREDSTVLVTLNWQQRLYSSLGFATHAANFKRGQIKINPHQKVVFVSLKKWKNLIDCLVKHNFNSLNMASLEVDHLETAIECKGTHSDVSSESADGVIKKLQTEFSSTFSRSQVIPVQLGCEKKGGLEVPAVHLVEITRNIKCCIQHMSDPVKCFASYANVHAGNRKMSSKEYIQRWLNIFRMESSTNAVKSTSIIINDLHVCFRCDEEYDGSFVISKTFCQERDIFIDYTWNEEGEYENSHQTDFLCIRCELVRGVPSKAKADCPPNERWIWIGHGETKCFQRTKENENIKVHFKLHKESRKPTDSMVDAVTSTGLDCTVELIPMNEGDKYVEILYFDFMYPFNFVDRQESMISKRNQYFRHIEKTLMRLDRVSLAKSIALRGRIPELGKRKYFLH